MTSTRWTYLLIVALVVGFFSSAGVQFAEIYDLARGDHGWENAVAVGWLAWSAVAVIAALGLARSSWTARGALHRNNQSLAADAATSPDWVWESDVQTRITYSNHGVQALLGYREEDLLGIVSTDLLFDDAAREQAHATLSAAQDARSGWTNAEFQWRHKDGHPVILQGTAAAIYDEKHRLIGFRGTRRMLTPGLRDQELVRAAHDRVTDVLRTNGFDIALQPIVDLTSGRLTGMEALARFHDGRGPDLWFRDANDAGLAQSLEKATFAAAVRLFPRLPHEAYLSVNASPELLMDPDFAGRLLEAGCPLDRLVIEITEHAKVPDYAQLNAALDFLRNCGVRFAIDDTGAGYASLNHVIELRPDIIKLDRALISRLNEDRARRSLVTALVLLALDTGAAITAEGVETNEQLDTLITLGVDQAQGYLLAKPTFDSTEWQQWPQRMWLNELSEGPLRTGRVTRAPSR